VFDGFSLQFCLAALRVVAQVPKPDVFALVFVDLQGQLVLEFIDL
jgi:hypothetical protein